MNIDDIALDRFWTKVDKTPTCWLWTGALYWHGYGKFWFHRRWVVASRFSWAIEHGTFPLLFVCHHCDVPACVRPEHLFEGSQADNLRDAARKGRIASGERHGMNTHPELRRSGDKHWSKFHPERVASGDRNGSRTHPEMRPRGEGNGCAKLTDQRIREIRQRYTHGGISQHTLAREYGISQTACSLIILRKTWGHVV